MEDTSGLPQPPPLPAGVVNALDIAAAQGPAPREDAMPRLSEVPRSQEEMAAGHSITAENNPSVGGESLEETRKRMLVDRGARLSLNAPNRRLEVPPIEGYHQHWFAEYNVHLALAAWYEFVSPKEQPIVDRSIGGRSPGNTSEDLGGNQVRQIGGMGNNGQPVHLVLMKIRQEFYFDEQRKIAERNLSIINQIFHRKAPLRAPDEKLVDYDQRYTREAVIDMSNGRFRKV